MPYLHTESFLIFTATTVQLFFSVYFPPLSVVETVYSALNFTDIFMLLQQNPCFSVFSRDGGDYRTTGGYNNSRRAFVQGLCSHPKTLGSQEYLLVCTTVGPPVLAL